ncbi:MAG TPA: site-specific integrase, partial [Pseudonocardiaceae bacterium]|nr:site-specific integrase [Pseudonocardiaceae bacterium]
TPDDLRWTPILAPTFAEYIPVVRAATGPGANRTYGSYWNRISDAYATRRLDEVAATDIEILMRKTIANTVARRNSRGGSYAGEHLLAAIRALYTRAIADGLIHPHGNPTADIRKPRRPANNRRALTSPELAAINHTATTTGDDPVLDTLLLRLHHETACRRQAAILLQEDDLDEQWCLLRLREKNQAIRWQPISPTLTHTLAEHHTHRSTGQPSTGRLLRYHDGSPLTTRRYDHLWRRIGHHLPWVAAQNISIHWLRHTTLTWVERHYGHGIARAYAGHTSKTDTTSTYTKANLADIATALSAMTGEPHPHARPDRHVTSAMPPRPLGI